MKQPLVTLLLAAALLLTSFTHAQSWCPSGATWVHSTGNPLISEGGAQFTYTGDTVVDGFVAQRITEFNSFTINIGNGDEHVTYWGPDVTTRTETGIVFFWLPDTQEWDTLYWFSAQPGDRWAPGWEQGYNDLPICDDDTYFRVLDTATVDMNGVPLRTLTVETIHNGEAVDQGVIMERIGYVNGYFIPRPIYCFVDECLCSFGCYADDELGRYPESAFQCQLSTAVEEVLNTVPWTVSPVPFSDRFTVRSPDLQAGSTLVLLDMTGRMLQTHSFQGDVVEVDAKQLATGSYVLRMVDPRGNHLHRVVIKE